MKKLNNKGFTLIELLAVIVILAVVMGISANAVLTSINNSRKSALYSAAQNAANTLNNWATEDAMTDTDGSRVLGNAFVKYLSVTKKNSWVCLTDSNVTSIINRGDANKSLLGALGISNKDIVNATNEAAKPPTGAAAVETGNASVKTCSAIRYNSSTGAYELLFVAREGGKYYVSTDTSHYAYNTAAGVNTSLS